MRMYCPSIIHTHCLLFLYIPKDEGGNFLCIFFCNTHLPSISAKELLSRRNHFGHKFNHKALRNVISPKNIVFKLINLHSYEQLTPLTGPSHFFFSTVSIYPPPRIFFALSSFSIDYFLLFQLKNFSFHIPYFVLFGVIKLSLPNLFGSFEGFFPHPRSFLESAPNDGPCFIIKKYCNLFCRLIIFAVGRFAPATSLIAFELLIPMRRGCRGHLQLDVTVRRHRYQAPKCLLAWFCNVLIFEFNCELLYLQLSDAHGFVISQSNVFETKVRDRHISF